MKILVTGVAGFIGMSLAAKLLECGEQVLGVDSLNDYYDPHLKLARLEQLRPYSSFEFHQLNLADRVAVDTFSRQAPEITTIVHLAAQAGVRHALKEPFAYLESNLVGQMVLLEWARRLPRLEHLVYASSSSVYGENHKVPFAEEDAVDRPISLYAATKRSDELLAYSYSHIYKIPMTGLRFFTVYGPWGRPDMAPWLFTKSIIEGESLRLFNHGKMQRDFTYIDDIVDGIIAAISRPPVANAESSAPHRLYNLGNDKPIQLMDFIQILESIIGKAAVYQLVEAQPGDVPATWADLTRSRRELNYAPKINLTEGLTRFVDWYRQYHK